MGILFVIVSLRKILAKEISIDGKSC